MGAHRVPIRGPEGARKEKSRSVADGSTWCSHEINCLHVGARWGAGNFGHKFTRTKWPRSR